jgi:general secretion pathway protein A
MYLTHFGLTDAPFSITPDTRFLFLTERHRDALAHLMYGVAEGRGLVQLTGEVGTGKTTLCRRFLEQLPDHVDAALILNPRLTGPELLAAVCDDLHIPYPAGTESVKLLVDGLYRHLLDAHGRGRRTVLVIDEAQNLAPEVLEEIRLLTNLETARDKLLQIVLIGQPELIRLLERKDLRQVAQRITARYHLAPFSERETLAYIGHRLGVAGVKRSLFSFAAMREIHRVSGGVPRLINIVADRALLGAYTEDQHEVDRQIVRRAADEALGLPRSRQRRWLWLSAASVGVAVVLGVWVTARPGRPAWTPASIQAPLDRGSAPMTPASEPSPPMSAAEDSKEPPNRALALARALADPSIPSDRRSALAILHGLWGLYRPGEIECEPGRDAARKCLFLTGNWARLRRFDVPAVLELVNPQGDRRYAALVALKGGTATLAFGERQLAFPLAEIDQFWNRAFILLWKAQPRVGTVLGPGARGRDVAWLRRQLDALDGNVASYEPAKGGAGQDLDGAQDVYDDQLRSRVAEFQRTRSLAPDGLAGEETLMNLVAALEKPPVPRLSSPAETQSSQAARGSAATVRN